jgi:hypothetical protein
VGRINSKKFKGGAPMKWENYFKRGLLKWWRVSVLAILLFVAALYFLPTPFFPSSARKNSNPKRP